MKQHICHAGGFLLLLASSAISADPQVVDVFVAAPRATTRTGFRPLSPRSRARCWLSVKVARPVEADSGDIDLLVRRSGDQGRSWEKARVVWNDGQNTCGDPCPVVDQATGTIWLLMTWNLGTDEESTIMAGTSRDVRHAYVTSSTDDGLTWSVPVNISSQVRKPYWRWYATGPGNAIQLTRGPHQGRLLIPANHSDHSDPTAHPYRTHVFWSDDHGASWQLGGVAADEPLARDVVRAGDRLAPVVPGVQAVPGRRGQVGRRRLADLARYGAVYEGFEKEPATTELGRFLYRLNAMEVTTAYPALLWLLGPDGFVEAGERQVALGAIESWLVRRMLTRQTTKNYNIVFLALLKRVREAAGARSARRSARTSSSTSPGSPARASTGRRPARSSRLCGRCPPTRSSRVAACGWCSRRWSWRCTRALRSACRSRVISRSSTSCRRSGPRTGRCRRAPTRSRRDSTAMRPSIGSGTSRCSRRSSTRPSPMGAGSRSAPRSASTASCGSRPTSRSRPAGTRRRSPSGGSAWPAWPSRCGGARTTPMMRSRPGPWRLRLATPGQQGRPTPTTPPRSRHRSRSPTRSGSARSSVGSSPSAASSASTRARIGTASWSPRQPTSASTSSRSGRSGTRAARSSIWKSPSAFARWLPGVTLDAAQAALGASEDPGVLLRHDTDAFLAALRRLVPSRDDDAFEERKAALLALDIPGVDRVPDGVLRLIDHRAGGGPEVALRFAAGALACDGVTLRPQQSKCDPWYFQVRHPRFRRSWPTCTRARARSAWSSACPAPTTRTASRPPATTSTGSCSPPPTTPGWLRRSSFSETHSPRPPDPLAGLRPFARGPSRGVPSRLFVSCRMAPAIRGLVDATLALVAGRDAPVARVAARYPFCRDDSNDDRSADQSLAPLCA